MNIIGDIAGQFEALRVLFDKIPKQKTILLGDPNDRGPNSKDVIQFCIDNQDMITLLDSNHADMFVDWYKSFTDPMWIPRYDNRIFYFNGGGYTLRNYNLKNYNDIDELQSNKVLKEHIEFLASRPSHIFETINGNNYLFTHAPLNPNPNRTFKQFLDRADNPRDVDFNENYLWNRSEPKGFNKNLKGNVISVFGHNSGFDLKLICKQYRNGIYIKNSNQLKELIDINLNQIYGIGVDTSRDSKLCCLDLNNLNLYYEGYK